MKSINNRNSNGYFKTEDLQGRLIKTQADATCSQYVKQTFSTSEGKVKDGKLTFYYPKDWLLKMGRNPNFFAYWIKLTSELFHEVKYLGIKKSEDLNLVFNDARKGFLLQEETTIDVNNFMFRDRWMAFEMEIKNNSYELQNRQYCAYCMIRYLFSDHYDLIIKNFNAFRRIKKAYQLPISEFELLQMAHMYFAGYNGYHQTYCLIHYGTIDNYIYRLISLDDFKTNVKAVSGEINNMFKSRGETSLKIAEFQKRIDNGELKKLYDAIK